MREVGNQPARDGKRAQNAKMLFRRNEPKDLLKPKELSIFRFEKQSEFSGQKPAIKAKNMAKNPPLVGHFPVRAALNDQPSP
jgi:hypothetical protein